MLTQNPIQRAKTLLRGATKPVRIFLGHCAIGQGKHALSATDNAQLLTRSLPWTEITVPHDIDPDQLAQAFADQWHRLNGERIATKPIPHSTPDRRHGWRQSEARRNAR